MSTAELPSRQLPGLPRPVSVIGAGCWTIGGIATNAGVSIGWSGVNDREALAALWRAHELGVTLFDTADVYGMGRSERLLGQLLRHVDRRQLTVSSKVGYFAGTAEHPYTAAQMKRQFETTLTNLGTEHLDVYFLHSSDFGPADRYLDEAADTMTTLRAAGRITAVGMRAPHEFAQQWATDPEQPQYATTTRWLQLYERVQPDVLTVRHSMLSPVYDPTETDIFAFAQLRGVGVIVKQALAQGLLTGRCYPSRPPQFPPGDHRHSDPRFGPPVLTALAGGLSILGARFGDTPADRIRVALQYVLATAPEAAVLTGFRNPEQIAMNTTSLGEPLSTEDLAEITTVMSQIRKAVSLVMSNTGQGVSTA